MIAADGIRAPWQPGSFDRVMLDAPCTGLGALRRRPESRWRRGPEDLERLTRVQRRLLSSALDSVRPGGLVAYVTCSPHLEETRDVVRQVVKSRRDVERVDARPLLPGVPDLGGGPDIQLWPHLHGTDAMYLALLRRSWDDRRSVPVSEHGAGGAAWGASSPQTAYSSPRIPNACSRISTLRTFPVTVMGNPSTRCT